MRGKSPVAVAHFTDDAGDSVVGQVAKGAEKLREKRRALADDRLQFAGDLAGKREQHIRILAERSGEPFDLLFARRRLQTALDLAKIGRFEVYLSRDAAEREGRINLCLLLAHRAHVVGKRLAHALVCRCYYTPRQAQYPPPDCLPSAAEQIHRIGDADAVMV